MRRAVSICGLLLAALASCIARMSTREADGATVLRWAPIAVPDGAEDVRYELAVFEAEQGLPRGRRLSRSRLTETEYELRGLAPGEYVWTVRARYRRDGRDWVTRWRSQGSLGGGALVPQRGFCPLSVK